MTGLPGNSLSSSEKTIFCVRIISTKLGVGLLKKGILVQKKKGTILTQTDFVLHLNLKELQKINLKFHNFIWRPLMEIYKSLRPSLVLFTKYLLNQ